VIACQRVLANIQSRSDVRQLKLKDQVQHLLLPAIRDAACCRLIVLVIDALDECIVTDGVQGGTLIEDLVHVLRDLPIKLVVTSRMEESLRRMFRSLPTHVVKLHEIEHDSVTHDVRLILSKGFADIVKKHEITLSPWPSEREFDILVERTGRLIIFAVTVLKFIDSPRLASPQTQLSRALEQTSTSHISHQYELVDQLYLEILNIASRYRSETTDVDTTLCGRILNLISTIVLLEEPLSIPALAMFIKVPEDELARDVAALSAVLLVGPDKDRSGAELINIFHPSLRDFLLQRCSNSKFAINTTHRQQILSEYCLDILNATLKYDICDIKDPTVPHLKVTNPTLSQRLQAHLSMPAQYACRFWINHIADL
jgi:hypothetical protein